MGPRQSLQEVLRIEFELERNCLHSAQHSIHVCIYLGNLRRHYFIIQEEGVLLGHRRVSSACDPLLLDMSSNNGVLLGGPLAREDQGVSKDFD